MRVSLAGASDAAELLELTERLGGAGASHLAERLAIAPGDDHFVLILRDAGGSPVGYLSAGGSRDPDGKGGGELYEVVIEQETATGETAALIGEAIGLLDAAGYGDVTVWSTALRGIELGSLVGLGFAPDGTAGRHRRPRTAAQPQSSTATPVTEPEARSVSARGASSSG